MPYIKVLWKLLKIYLKIKIELNWIDKAEGNIGCVPKQRRESELE